MAEDQSVEMAERRWTIQDLGAALRTFSEREKERDRQLGKLYEVVVTGNGEPSIREQVRTHERWIGNANKVIWIVVAATIGQFITLMCGVMGWIYYLTKGSLP